MNKLHVYTGSGKGKTTAAMGLALRSLGHGNRTLIGQFMKDGRSGELTALAQFPNATVCPSEPLHGFVGGMTDSEKHAAAQAQSAYIDHLIREIERTQPQTIILDELGVALQLNMVTEADAKRLLACALQSGETAVTGMMVPQWLLDRADYISRIDAERHPYATEGLAARKGVEW